MATDFVRISENDLERWGALIKTMATGIDHLNGPLVVTGDVVAGPPVANTPANQKLLAAIARLRERQQKLEANNTSPQAIPPMLSRAEFLAVLDEQRVAMSHDPGNWDWVDFGQTHGRVLAVRLPCAEVILEKQGVILSFGGYALPGHVVDWVVGAGRGSPPTRPDQLRLNTMRVGNYSVAHCEG